MAIWYTAQHGDAGWEDPANRVQPAFDPDEYPLTYPLDEVMSLNTCWPAGIAGGDPRFELLAFDPWCNGKPHFYNYSKDYVKGLNGW